MLATLPKIKLVFILGLVFCLHGSLVWGGSFLLSAHGNKDIGVKNINYQAYSRGNCAHCHQQHSTQKDPLVLNNNPFALFASNFDTSSTTGYQQEDDFCFYCHGNPSVQEGGITNYDYARTFGGYTVNGPTTILEAFQQNSFHNLYDIWTFAKNTFSSFFTPYSNPCVACHNPHLVRRIKANVTDPAPYTVVSLPTDHGSLWGDENGERMSDFDPGKYQAPKHYQSGYEPGGNAAVWDGSNLPDYAPFCPACHNPVNTIYSTTLGRNLIKIEWVDQGGESGPGDKHGKNSATEDVELKSPYADSNLGISLSFTTSCTDCHEPHGSPNPFLIRREVNGVVVNIDLSQKNGIGWLCRACHMDDHDFDPDIPENSWHHVHHGGGPLIEDPPYPSPVRCGWCHGGPPGANPIPCLNCHQHGLDDSWLQDVYSTYYTGRRCF